MNSRRALDGAAPAVAETWRVCGESLGAHLPGESLTFSAQVLLKDVTVQFFTHRDLVEPILVPAVVEPLLVLVLSGSASVEERVPGEAWQSTEVGVGDFFLTSTDEPYEMRWQVLGRESFQVMHLYLGLPLIEQAAQEQLGERAARVPFRDVSGGRDPRLKALMQQLRDELLEERTPSPLFGTAMAQAIAVHLLRHYRAATCSRRRVNALQAHKLSKVTAAMNTELDNEFSLSRWAAIAELSESHFSRQFKQAMGLSPSQYFIRLRMARARHLLLGTSLSILDIGLEVGYSSAAHFSQVFRREVGMPPSQFRQG